MTDTLLAEPRPATASNEPANRVARATAAFWVLKIVATTLGETGADLLSMTLEAGYAVSSLICLGFFVAALTVQLRSGHFRPAVYWTVILTTSTAGTTMSDFMDRTLGLGYATGSLVIACALVAALTVWRVTEKTISVDSIRTPRAEGFYWAAILLSNTLGTALGDCLADDSGLGFLGSAALIAGLLAAVLAAWRFTRIDRVALFWTAFVLTRPFGATFGDLLTKTPAHGGVGLGTIGTSAVLAAILALLVARTSRVEQRAAAARS